MSKVDVLSVMDRLIDSAIERLTPSQIEEATDAREVMAEIIKAASAGESGYEVGWPSAMLFTPAKASRLRSALAKVSTDEKLDVAVAKGSKAWEDTPEGWVDELRGGPDA